MATPSQPPAGTRSIRPAVVGLVAAVVIGAGVLGGVAVAGLAGPSAGGATGTPPGSAVAVVPTPSSSPITGPATGPSALPSAVPSASPGTSPAPSAAPQLVEAPLTGLLVSPAAAIRHPIAVMIDDQVDARPQAGFNAASIVWQAPAEGGIPRYMLIFQDKVPSSVGPVRSSREYFIEWASEWDALYVHAGGSPQALATLGAHGHGQWVYNGEYFHWAGVYLWRVTGTRFPPHNVFTDGAHLRALAKQVGAKDKPIKPVWQFTDDAPVGDRVSGTILTVAYPYEAIQYRYDPITNTYLRYIRPTSGGSYKLQVDAADHHAVAPKNVVILQMAFGPLNDGHPNKHRLEASDVGHGVAYISTNGRTIKGTWRKASTTAPTLLFGPNGRPVTLTAGQTFVQVMQLTDTISIHQGHTPLPDRSIAN